MDEGDVVKRGDEPATVASRRTVIIALVCFAVLGLVIYGLTSLRDEVTKGVSNEIGSAAAQGAGEVVKALSTVK